MCDSMLKRLFFSLFCWLMAVGIASAQELTVKSMEAAPMDLSASQYRRPDKNERPCALVKVQLTAKGAVFGGNVIGDVEYKTNEYWVYMSEGSYMLNIKHPDYLSLMVNFRDYGIRSVESLNTYKLVIAMPVQENEVKKQKLVINYTPKDAMVLIDSKPYPGSGHVEIVLPLGEHSYMIAANGYITAEGMVKLNGGSQRVLNETLEKEAAAPVATVQQPVTQQASTLVAATASATSGMENGHEWVDLGLSVRWATMNIGASTPGDYGDYYAWGETTPKSDYSQETYQNKIILSSLQKEEDTANFIWSGKWRMPTFDELNELLTECKWEWREQDGHDGYQVLGPNGNSIFLPAAGCHNKKRLINEGKGGYYATSSSLDTSSFLYTVCSLYFFGNTFRKMNNEPRFNGLSIRPVKDP